MARRIIAMVCAYCGRMKLWPTDFPARHLARCDHCTSRCIAEDTAAFHEVIIGGALLVAIAVIALAAWAGFTL